MFPSEVVKDSIIHTDIHYGRLAKQNYLTKMGKEGKQMVITCTINLEDIACLWRNDKVTEPQMTHADTDAGNYRLVLPLSEQYKMEMFPGTHLIIDRKKGEQDGNRVT